MTDPALEREPSVVIPLNAHERHAPGEELASADADSWESWSDRIVGIVMPMLGALKASLPGLESALVSTADGFGLCSLGLDDTTMRRVSSMASSMTSLASAATAPQPQPVAAGAATSGADDSIALVTLVHGNSITVVLPVRLEHEDLLLSVTVSGPTLGSLLYHAELTSDRIRAALA